MQVARGHAFFPGFAAKVSEMTELKEQSLAKKTGEPHRVPLGCRSGLAGSAQDANPRSRHVCWMGLNRAGLINVRDAYTYILFIFFLFFFFFFF